MGVNIQMALPTEEDIVYLASYMRQADINELRVTCDLSPIEAIKASINKTEPDFLFAVFANGRLICIGGCASTLLSGAGTPWLLATEEIQLYTRRLTRDAIRGVRMMLEKWSILSNVVDARNTASIRWLKAIGFDMTETIEIKPGYSLIRFVIHAHSNTGSKIPVYS